ncbi:mechanosensitive ion channel family protein [Pontibacter burrus]|uniref:Mechanosensitive ion channel family protein n=1 Tax=Pontibacter burrus TaxID=2704466 RepID=A0A6B3LSD3_9BACT|nr:mechanosensitive ion channel family protein [Pontibacter burrus]NEM96404.1 mechanosensitive ion channel family protein [Pontibacter burrus]
MNDIDKAFELLFNKLEQWGHHLVLMLPNLILALVLLVITFVVARIIRNGLDKVIARFSHSPALNNLISTLLHLSIVMVGFLLVLSVLKLDNIVISLLAGVGIAGLALGFAFQDIAANFISGTIIAVQKPFGVGDMIETNDYFGVIERISLRTVDIRKVTGELVKLPNKMVFENPVTNYSFHGIRRIDLDVRVSYNEDLEMVQQVVIEALQEVKNRVKTRDVEVMYDKFAESSIDFKVRFWVTYSRQFDYVSAKSDAIIRIKKAFDSCGIVIPLPMRKLDFHTKPDDKIADQLGAIKVAIRNENRLPGTDA